MALTDGLAGWFNFNEASGSRADSSGNGNTLTESGAVASVAGLIGNAALFDGSGNHLTGSIAAFNPLVTVGFSCSVWVFLTADIGSICGTGSYSGYWGIEVLGGSLHCYFAGNEGGGIVATGAWKHIAFTVEPGEMSALLRTYVDGVEQGTAAINASANPTSGDFQVGAGGIFPLGFPGEGFAAPVDMLGVWNRKLSGAEILQLFNSNAGFDPTAGGGGGGDITSYGMNPRTLRPY